MRNNLIKILVLFLSILAIVSCKAQQVYPLNTAWDEPPNGSYFKDLHNELDQFVGTWKANYSDEMITLIVVKEQQQPFSILGKSFYKDQLSVRYKIVNNNGLIVHSTLNNNFTINQDFQFLSVASRQSLNEVTLVYKGGRCSIGLGAVYFKKINATQLQWNYKPEGTVLSDATCPPPVDTRIYLPTTENLIFTKQ